MEVSWRRGSSTHWQPFYRVEAVGDWTLLLGAELCHRGDSSSGAESHKDGLLDIWH